MDASGDRSATQTRAAALVAHGSVSAAVAAGALAPTATVSLAEAVVLGLAEQQVRTYVGVLGHGSTAIGEVLRIYSEAGAVRFAAVRHETEAAHAATALRMASGERAAVLTSIGPGALQAFAGALTAASNGVGVWHIYGDSTTEAESPNMQDLPASVQSRWQQLTSNLGASYSLHTPHAVTRALQQGAAVVDHPYRPGPFFLLLPLNTQPELLTDFNLRRLPRGGGIRLGAAAPDRVGQAAQELSSARRVVVKVGGGARSLGHRLERLLAATAGVAVLSPNSVGALHPDHPRNMTVGGSKGSISGNYAMTNAETLVVLGSRAVCQSDCSRTGYPNVTSVININADPAAATHYAGTLALVGDLERTVEALCDRLDDSSDRSVLAPGHGTGHDTGDNVGHDTGDGTGDDSGAWLEDCAAARLEWDHHLKVRTAPVMHHDPRWGRPVLSQAAALWIIEEWAIRNGVLRWFDAGDVQATAFQVSRDHAPELSFTDGGASYMGFGTSALLASALSDRVPYSLSVVGDGSFLMNPQALIDGVVHGARGAVVVLDNRRMGAISALQQDQYGADFATSDDAQIDYMTLASSISGVLGRSGDGGSERLRAALDEVYEHAGVGLVHVPVYYGDAPEANIGAFGRWNVGNWVAETQALRHRIDL